MHTGTYMASHSSSSKDQYGAGIDTWVSTLKIKPDFTFSFRQHFARPRAQGTFENEVYFEGTYSIHKPHLKLSPKKGYRKTIGQDGNDPLGSPAKRKDSDINWTPVTRDLVEDELQDEFRQAGLTGNWEIQADDRTLTSPGRLEFKKQN